MANQEQLRIKLLKRNKDMCEEFQWKDGNPDREDRIGYFVGIIDKKLVFATNKYNVIGVTVGSLKNRNKALVKLLGTVYVYDDDKMCSQGKKCTVAAGGVAVNGTDWYIIERISDKVIKIMYK